MRFDYALFALLAPLAVLGDLRHSSRRSHHDIAKRADASVQLHKRYSSTRWTFYDVGGAAGACGAYNSPDQHIVALNSAQYGGGYPGPMCGKTIVMILNGKQTTATITDECPGCPYGGLDLTRGLFQFFAPLSAGVITGEWYFADDAPAAPQPVPKPSPKPEPKTTHTPPPPPPSTTHHTTTSTTHTTPKTTSTEQSSTHSSTHSTHSSSSSSSSSVTSLKVSSLVSSIVAVPTGVISAGDGPGRNIAGFNQALLNMGNLVVAGTHA